jgi:hypothetical protein
MEYFHLNIFLKYKKRRRWMKDYEHLLFPHRDGMRTSAGKTAQDVLIYKNDKGFGKSIPQFCQQKK